MLHCVKCQCIIVPGRAFLTSDGYYCQHCIEKVFSTLPQTEMKREAQPRQWK